MEIIIGYEYNGRFYKSVIKRSDNSHIRYIKINGKEVYINNRTKSVCDICKMKETCRYHKKNPDDIITFCPDFK